MSQTDNQINQITSLHELLDGLASAEHHHLKVFMSRKKDAHKLPQDFLYIDPCSFGKVTVLDLWYRDDKICIKVQESATRLVKEISVVVNARPDFLMVRWDDIVKMVQNERTSSTSSDQLLDFEY